MYFITFYWNLLGYLYVCDPPFIRHKGLEKERTHDEEMSYRHDKSYHQTNSQGTCETREWIPNVQNKGNKVLSPQCWFERF